MSHPPGPRRAGRITATAAATAALVASLLTGCGGGADLPYLPGVTCSTAEERVWLADYFDDWYFWYRLAPDPSPLTDRSLAAFFQAKLYTGSDARFPRDRWSRMESSADFDRFFGDGQTLGYGLFLAGIEVAGQPDRPLRVRYVEARSDAAAQGVRRGDEIVSANGRSAAQLIAADDFGAFMPAEAGQTLALVLRRDGVERSLSLRASVYDLTPVNGVNVVQTAQGRRMGHLVVKDMISQAEGPLEAAFADFKAAGVQELVIDLRYNGGGRVSTALWLASLVSGARAEGQTFTRLLYNDRQASRNDESYRLRNPSAALGLTRVYVLAGPRTCSASELVMNGLRPFVDVVVIGDTSCGKPVGFVPVSRCGTTFSVVNFEAVNARDQGRYFDGIAATCPVADDLSMPLGEPGEALLDAARQHADSGRCPSPSLAAERRRSLQATLRRGGGEPAERQGLWAP
jgi:hypothetical protein